MHSADDRNSDAVQVFGKGRVAARLTLRTIAIGDARNVLIHGGARVGVVVRRTMRPIARVTSLARLETF